MGPIQPIVRLSPTRKPTTTPRATPNPTSGRFILVLDFPTEKEVYASIYDVAGKAIMLNIPVDGQRDFDLTDKAAGVYLLRINVGILEVTKRVVVSR